MKKELSVNIDMLLTELNNASLTNEKRAEILTTIVDLESEKPDGDMDLIRECLDYLAYLNNAESEAEARKEQLSERLQRIYQKAGEEDSAGNGKKCSAGRKLRLRKAGIVAAIIAAILLVAVTSLTVIARVNGYDDPMEWLIKLVKAGQEGTIDANGVTYNYTPNVEIYPDVESWLKEETLNILYPSFLPDGVEIHTIMRSHFGEGKVDITFGFNTPEMSFQVQDHDLDQFETFSGMEIIVLNGCRVSIFDTPESDPICHAWFSVDGFGYKIGAQDRDTVLAMIENLKKSGS